MKRKIHREDIIKTGQDLMFLYGYHATGIKEITDSIDIPKGSFYNHFSSKEEFGLEVLQKYCENGVEFYKRSLIESALPPLERLDKFFSDMIQNYRDVVNCKLGCIMGNFSLELADTNERFRKILDDEFNRCEAIITQCLLEAQKNDEISNNLDTKLLGGFILNSWHGAMLRMKSTASTKPLDDFKKMVFNQLLK